MVMSSAALLKSNKKLYFLPECEPVLKSYNDILRTCVYCQNNYREFKFSNGINFFPFVLRSNLELWLKLDSLLLVREPSCLLWYWYIHTYSEIFSKLSRRAACCAHGNTTLLFLFSSKRLFLEWRWWWHQKLQTNQDHRTAGYLHAAELIPITQLLPKRTCSFNSRVAAFLQWFHLHLLPQDSLFARVCLLWALQLPPPHQTRVHRPPQGKLRQQCQANSTVSSGIMPAFTIKKG